MQFWKVFLLAGFVCYAPFLLAQSPTLQPEHPKDSSIHRAHFPFYLDVDMGLFIGPDFFFFSQMGGSIGWRITRQHAVGLEARSMTEGYCCLHTDAQGLGLVYRMTFGRFFLKPQGGKILRAYTHWDSNGTFTYQDGGHYVGATIGYHFKGGFLLAYQMQKIWGLNFILAEEDWNSADLVLIERPYPRDFAVFTVSLGLSLPADHGPRKP
ncbi:MAG: hypothetical protein AAFR61_06785 [Bacteroidota bacterium]